MVALLADDLHEGEAEFVKVEPTGGSPEADAAWAARQAFEKLKERLDRPDLNFWFGPSHPRGERD